MAISPKHLDQEFQKEINTHEQYFDKYLSTKSICKGQTINIDIPSGFNASHFYIIKQRYINAGWSNVDMESDQREGTWLSFKY